MTARIKFCGLTQAEDAHFAAWLGAAYAGVIFAGGPRMLTVERAAEVLAPVPPTVQRVGVFAEQSVEEIAQAARALRLGAVQLHARFDATRIDALRAAFGGEIWSVCRVAGASLPADFDAIASTSDAVLLDAYVPGTLGGTGVAIPWTELADALKERRGTARIVLAGGLRPENVAEAIAALAPNVVDVSSGVESAPGIKDHIRMRAFRDAVSPVSIPS